MSRLALLCALALCAACVAPVRPAPTVPAPPPIRVGIDHTPTDHGLPADIDSFVRAAVMVLDHQSGARWVMVPDGAPADVRVRRLPMGLVAQCDGLLGLRMTFDDAVYLLPGCLEDGPSLQHVIEHELMHWVGGAHICRAENELPDMGHTEETCAPVGFGRAILNPYVDYPETHGQVDLDLTDLDRAELARARRGGPRRPGSGS